MGVERRSGGRKRRKAVGDRTPRARYNLPCDLTDFLDDLVTDPEVQGAVRDYIVSGKDGAVQLFFEAVAHVVGRPRVTVRLDVTPDLARLLSMVDPSGAEEMPGEVEQVMDGDSASLPQ